jgi:hypothetical protein
MRIAGRILPILLVTGCLLVYGYSIVDLSAGRAISVNVDLAKPISIVWPCEVSVVGDMGEPGLRIPPKVGSGWRGKAGGEAVYRFYVPQDDKYYLWTYCLWFDKCTNAIYAQIDGLDKAIVGNDPIFQKWHWVRGFGADLKRGPHALKLSNHSDHVTLQKLVLVNSRTVVPDACSIIFSDLFYDGFDGCHIGNFTSWKVLEGQWEVERPKDGMCYVENALTGRSQKRAMIVYPGEQWTDYSYHVAASCTPSSDPAARTGICFGVQDPNHFYYLKWAVPEEGSPASMELGRQSGTQSETLGTFVVAWNIAQWHNIEILSGGQTLKVRIDRQDRFSTSLNEPLTGDIGLLLEGACNARFDDIHVRTVTEQHGS